MRNPHLLAVLAMVCWGVAYVPSALLVESWEPLPAAALRLLLAGVILLAVARLSGADLRPGVSWWVVAWLGLTQTTIFYGATFVGIAHESAGLAAVLSNIDPLFVAALGVILLSETLAVRQWLGLAVGLAGATLAASPQSIWPLEFSAVALLVMVGALAWAVGTITAARGVRSRAAPVTLAGWQMVIGGLLLLPAGGVFDQLPGPAGGSEALLIAILAIFGSALPLALFYRALTQAPAAELSAWFFLVPVVGVLLAWPLLGEQPSESLLIGMAAVSAGLWLVLGGRPPATARPRGA